MEFKILKRVVISIFLLSLTISLLEAKTSNYLRHTFLKENRLTLIFKYDVASVKHFTIRGHGVVKHVYDIFDTSLPKTEDISQFKAKGVRAFRIAQFNKKLIRVVIDTTIDDYKGIFTLKGRVLSFILPSDRNILNQPIPKIIKKHHKIVKHRYRFKNRKRYHYNRKRRVKIIILDAGHGGRDIGASGYGVREKDITLSMTLKLKTILQKMGYRVFMTHKRDIFMNLRERTEYANRHKGSIFVAIHANAAPKKRTPHVLYKGIELFYLSVKNSNRVKDRRAVYRGKKLYSRADYRKMTSASKYYNSKILAKVVKSSMLKNIRTKYNVNDKGIKQRDFWVLLATKMPSILIETGYLTNKDEVKRLTDEHYQTLLVEGIANGINSYYGLY